MSDKYEGHTPGPWKMQVEDDGDGYGTIWVDPMGRLIHDSEWATPDEWDKDLANARLIADAPMLADRVERQQQALEMMDDWFGDQMTQNQVDIINTIMGDTDE